MFGLGEEIGGGEGGVGGVVADEHDFAGAREGVDADGAEDLPFCLGDVGVAGAEDFVDGGNCFCAC